MSVLMNPSGIAVHPAGASKRMASLTREQVRRTRNEQWLREHEEGVADFLGVVRRRSLREISRVWATPMRTVRDGIAEARRIREALRRALDRD